ncbi:radical SAM protein [bacterium]|nr:radical SAM protein [candidate division CSSED10-310 bacterium]
MKVSRIISTWPLAVLGLAPLSCNIKVTERCNLRCSMCGIWRRANRMNELSAADWRRIARILARWRLGRAVITGGEPFLRRDLEEIIRGFARYGFSITLLTNGTVPDTARFSRVIAAGVHDVGISLDTLDPLLQARIAGREGIHAAILASIATALKVTPGLVQVMITVSELNLSEIPSIVAAVHDMGAYAVVNPMNVALQDRQQTQLTKVHRTNPLAAIAPAEVDRIYDELVRMKRQGIRLLNSNRFLEDSRLYLKGGGYGWRCHAGDSYFTIFSDGSVAGCSDLKSFRNLHRDSGILPNRRFRTIYHQQRSACPGCIYSCWREVSYLLRDPATMGERLSRILRWLKERHPTA